MPIQVPNGVTVEFQGNTVKIKGPKGELTWTAHPRINLQLEENVLTVTRKSDEKLEKSLHGTSRAIINNLIIGVTKGFQKQLEVQGVGYKAVLQGKKLVLSLGFSHPVEYTAPDGIEITVDKEQKNMMTVSGIDKEKVGAVAAKIRSFKKPEPYKGKGIRYLDEQIQRKAGKTAGTGSGSA